MSDNPILVAFTRDQRRSACHRTQASIFFYIVLLVIHILSLFVTTKTIEVRGNELPRYSHGSTTTVSLPMVPQRALDINRNTSRRGMVQYYENTGVINIISADGPPLTQHFTNSRVTNVVTDGWTVRALGMETMSSRNLLQSR
jgi:hypothetical protein